MSTPLWYLTLNCWANRYQVRLYKEFLPLLHDTKLHTLGKNADSNSLYLVYLGTKPGSERKVPLPQPPPPPHILTY